MSNSKPFFCILLPVLEPGLLIVVQTFIFYTCMHILVCVCSLQQKNYNRNKAVFCLILLHGWFFFFLFFLPPFGVVQPRCCSSAVLHVSFSTGAVVTLPHLWRSSTTQKCCGCKGVCMALKAWRVSRFSLVFLCWSAIKINSLEWICSKTCAWAGWSLSTSILLNRGLKQQNIWLVCVLKIKCLTFNPCKKE